MKSRLALVTVVFIVAVVAGYFTWTYFNHVDYLSKTVHETDRWAVIMDSKGDIIAVETSSDEVWSTFLSLRENQTAMWVGGIVEEYENAWGFRFKPDTIIVAEITIEGAQSNIRGISEDLNYWINVWSKETYVMARIVEVHV